MGLRGGLENPYEASEEMSTFLRREVGLDPTHRIESDCADFYLLEWMVFQGYGPSKRALDFFENKVGRRFAVYLDLVLGGEIRHASSVPLLKVDDTIAFMLKDAMEMSREDGWKRWIRETGRMTIESKMPFYQGIYDAFASPNWTRSSAGGKMWAVIAQVQMDYVSRKIRPRIFIDRCFTLQHNNACVFDKVYNINLLNKMLVDQAEGKYDRLIPYASQDVKRLWNGKRRQMLKDYDPGWLGIQDITDVDE